MKSLSVTVGVILIGLAIFGYAEVWGADWKFYGSSENYLGYYDTQSITHISKSIVRVWTNWDYTEKGILYMVGKFGEKYGNLGHSKILQEINCGEKKFRQLYATDYDRKGSTISPPSSPSEWSFIIPDSMNEILYKEVCKQKGGNP